jgi:hypothetical protein
MPVGARFSIPFHTGLEAHGASCVMGTGSVSGWGGGVKRPGVALNTHPQSSRRVFFMGRDTPPLCLNAMLWIDLYLFFFS